MTNWGRYLCWGGLGALAGGTCCVVVLLRLFAGEMAWAGSPETNAYAADLEFAAITASLTAAAIGALAGGALVRWLPRADGEWLDRRLDTLQQGAVQVGKRKEEARR